MVKAARRRLSKDSPKMPALPPDRVDAPGRILEAARKEFVEQGFSGARMQAIARAAGVNHALIHYYFASKEKLYEASLREILVTVWGGLTEELRTLPPDAGFEVLLRALLKTHARILATHPEFLPFILREVLGEGRVPVDAKSEIIKSFGEVPRRINEGLLAEIKAGRLRPITPLNFWMNMVGMAAGGFVVSHVIRKGTGIRIPPGVEFNEKFFLERAEMIAAVLIRGLRPDAEPA